MEVVTGKNWVFVRLAGGLGNQLYQLAAASLCAKRILGQVIPIVGGLGSYQQVRTPDALNLISSELILPGTHFSQGFASWAIARARVGRWFPRIGFADRKFPARIPKSAKCMVLDGYFQTGWSAELLGEALTGVDVKSVPLGEVPKHHCLIHVRGSDFRQLESHGFLRNDYYANAVGHAVKAGHTSFGIVTDDPNYGAEMAGYLTGRYQGISMDVLPTSPNLLVDFERLRTADARIIGNSTFAWWATALDERAATTWSSLNFVKNSPRDFFLPWERPLRPDGFPAENY